MAIDVTTRQGNEKKEELVTRDFLGSNSGCVDERELWARKLELLSRTSTSAKKAGSGPVDLNLPPPPKPSFPNICTLERIKSVLERTTGKRTQHPKPAPNPKQDGSMRRLTDGKAPVDGGLDFLPGAGTGGAMMVTVCPRCFQYLLVPVVDPRCPRCDVQVPVKRARIGLSCSTSATNK